MRAPGRGAAHPSRSELPLHFPGEARPPAAAHPRPGSGGPRSSPRPGRPAGVNSSVIKSAGPARADSSRAQKGLCAQIAGLCFSGRLWVPSPRGGRRVPARRAPGLPLHKGRAGPSGASTAFPVASWPTLLASPPKHPALLLQ